MSNDDPQSQHMSEADINEYLAAGERGEMVGTFAWGHGQVNSATGDILLMDGRPIGIVWEALLAKRIAILLYRHGLVEFDDAE